MITLYKDGVGMNYGMGERMKYSRKTGYTGKSGYNRRVHTVLSAACLICVVLSCTVWAGQDLFDPEVYLGIGTGAYRSAGGEGSEMLVRYYDSKGVIQGEALGAVDYFSGTYNVIPKGSFITGGDGNDVIVLRTEDFGEVCRYDREDNYNGRAYVAKNHIGLLSADGSRLTVYDREGKTCADLKTDPSIFGSFSDDWSDRIDLTIYEPKGYVYVRLMKGWQTFLAAKILEDGSIQTSEEPGFPELLSSDRICGYMGENLIADAEDGNYRIVSPQGNVLRNVSSIHWVYPERFTAVFERGKADYAAVYDGTAWLMLDSTLQEIGRITEQSLDQYGNIQYAGSSVIGLPCEELGGAVSTDVLRYLRTDVPAAKVSDGYLVAGKYGRFLPDPGDGWTIDSFSDHFILLRNEALQRVMRRSDGAVLLETDRFVYLQNSSFLVEGTFSDADSRTTIYNEEMEELYSCSSWVYPCIEEYYFVHRGPWAGVIDAHGSWILKELQYDE